MNPDLGRILRKIIADLFGLREPAPPARLTPRVTITIRDQ
jgi:hypothetical protein